MANKAKRAPKAPVVVDFTTKKVPQSKQTNNFGFSKIINFGVVAAMVVALFGNSFVFAANPHTATIAINSITDDNGTHTPPFNFSCPGNPLFNPVHIAGSGTVTNPAGLISQYHYSVDWGDGTTTAGSVFTGSDPYSFSFNFGPHSYTTTGSFSISAKVYHSQSSGQDTTDAQTIPVTVCVHVPPTNNASVTVNKTVVNNNGGTASASAFTLKVNGTTVTNGVVADFPVANAPYTITESGPSGYTASFSGDCNSSGVIPTPVVAGNHYVCNMVNTDNAAHLTVIKHVVNNNGGNKTAADFTMNVTGNQVSSSSFVGSEQGTTISLNAGSYSVGETGPAGYAESNSADCSGTIALGQNKTCTITNDDIQPQLTVIKHVVSTGDPSQTPPQAADFTMTVTGQDNFPGSETGTVFHVNTGSYVVGELAVSNYTGVFSGGCDANGNVLLGIGDVKTCTITNTFQAPPPPAKGTLHIVKHVVNGDSGGSAASDFTMTVTGSNVSQGSFPGSENGTDITVDPGSYSVDEQSASGYIKSIGEGCSGTIASDQTVNCTITNTQTAHIIVDKVTNPSGNPQSFHFSTLGKGYNAFNLSDTAAPNDQEVAPGTYTVTEDPTVGWTLNPANADHPRCVYNNEATGNVVTNGETVTVDGGDTVTCTFTNTLNPITLSTTIHNSDHQAVTSISEGSTVHDSAAFSFTGPVPTGNVDFTFYSGSDAGVCDAQSVSAGSVAINESGVADPSTDEGPLAPGTYAFKAHYSGDENYPNGATSDCEPLTVTSNGGGNNNRATLTVTISANPGDGSGTVTSDDGFIDCHVGGETGCVKTYDPDGNTVTLTVHPDANSNFSGTWSGDCTGDTPVCTLTMSSDKTVNAHFSIAPTGNNGGGTNGGGGCIAGSSCGFGGNPTPPSNNGGQVLGDSTSVGSGLQAPQGQVLGASTTLPRTGMPVGWTLLILFGLGALLNKKLKLI